MDRSLKRAGRKLLQASLISEYRIKMKAIEEKAEEKAYFVALRQTLGDSKSFARIE